VWVELKQLRQWMMMVMMVVVVAHTVVLTFVLSDSPLVQPPYLAMFVEQTISRHQYIFGKMELLVLPLDGA
jgi:hypothetical protein